MKNKFKFLATCLLAIGMVGATTACEQLQDIFPGIGTQTPVTKYTVKFVNDDDSVISEVEYEEGATIEVPADPTKAATDSYTYTFAGWDSEVSATATANVTYKATYTKTAIEYTVTFMADDVQVGDALKYSADSKNIEAPAVPEKAHYTGVWESYTLNTGNKVVNAIYTPVEYTVVFKINGVQVGQTQKYTIENQNITVPSTPEVPEGYSECKWEAYDLSQGGDIVVNLVKVPTVYNVTFKADGVVVGTDTYTVEDKDITVPTVPAKDGYTAAWETYTLTVGDVEVNAVYKLNEYSIKFMDGETLVAEVKFNKDNKGEKTAPAGSKVGYTANWSAYSFDTLADQTATLTGYTANTYTITFDANGGTCQGDMQVTFDAAYTLPKATAPTVYQEFLGWKDASGKMVENGTWTIASDVTLTAVYTDGITFENMTEVPSYFEKADSTASVAIADLDGNKVLKMTASDNGTTTADRSPALKVTLEFLKSFFDNENVDYIAFDAKSEKGNCNNFRRDTNRGGALTAVAYEEDMTFEHDSDGDGTKEVYPTTGIRADAFKTFYFSRADYDFWVAQGVTAARFIASGNMMQGESFYIDNIRPVTAEERKAGIGSFESGGVRINDAGRTLLLYTLDQKTTWQFNIQVGSGQAFTKVGYTNENVTDGIRALEITKPAGDLAFNFTGDRAFYNEIIAKTGYYAFDIYIPEASDAKFNYTVATWPGVTAKKGAWTTIYMCDKKNQFSLTDTTGGTYCVDNIRSITADEYMNAAYSMEANTGGLRDGTTVFYYYIANDHKINRYSLAFTGNPAGVNYSREIVHDGLSSLKLTKAADAAQVNLQVRADSNFYAAVKNGFTFWIYSEKDLAASQICNAFDKPLVGGYSVKANEWTQITISAEDLKELSGEEGCAVVRIKGNWETIYIDGFAPLA